MNFLKRFSRLGVFLLLKGIAWVTRILPWRIALWLGGTIGLFFFYFSKRYRTRSLESFQTAFGPNPCDIPANQIIRKSFKNLGKSLIEILNLNRLDRDQMNALVLWEGEEYLENTKDNGIILITGHIGNWELMGAALSMRGFRVHGIGAPLHDPRMDRWLIQLRSFWGVETISRGTPSSSRKILEILRKKELLAVLIDQDTKGKGVFVHFFNKKAYTPIGAAQLALRSNATTVTAFITRLPDDRHRITIEKPVLLARTGNPKQDIEMNTAFFTARIEQHIRAYPDQWVWMHQRWKTEATAPPEETGSVHSDGRGHPPCEEPSQTNTREIL